MGADGWVLTCGGVGANAGRPGEGVWHETCPAWSEPCWNRFDDCFPIAIKVDNELIGMLLFSKCTSFSHHRTVVYIWKFWTDETF